LVWEDKRSDFTDVGRFLTEHEIPDTLLFHHTFLLPLLSRSKLSSLTPWPWQVTSLPGWSFFVKFGDPGFVAQNGGEDMTHGE
jgi:hypothetical protein